MTVKNKIKQLFGGLNYIYKLKHQHLKYFGVNGGILPIILHNVSSYDFNACEKLLTTLKKSYSFIDPKDFAEYINSSNRISGVQLMLTFDDGFYSSKLVAEKILEPLDIKAVYFVTTEFIDERHSKSIRKFIKKQLFDGALISDSVIDEMKPMSWEDVEWLMERGHMIGSHTCSHSRLSSIKNTQKLEYEIIVSAEKITEKLGCSVDFFAFPFGDIHSISPVALSMAGKKYKFVFSGIRGKNSHNTNRLTIRREAVSLKDSLSYNCFVAAGGLSFYYRSKRRLLDAMTKEIHE